jgi:hypothetical protein
MTSLLASLVLFVIFIVMAGQSLSSSHHPINNLFPFLLFAGLMVPANRLGHGDAQLSAATLRALAELAILIGFLFFNTLILKETLKVNHLVGFGIVGIGVFIVVLGPWDTAVLKSQQVFPMDVEGSSPK